MIDLRPLAAKTGAAAQCYMFVSDLKKMARARARDDAGEGARATDFTPFQNAILRGWLFDHVVYPYPSDEEEEALANATSLLPEKVSDWFIRTRNRLWRPMLKSIHKEAKEKAALESGGAGLNQGPDSTSNPRLRMENAVQERFCDEDADEDLQLSLGIYAMEGGEDLA